MIVKLFSSISKRGPVAGREIFPYGLVLNPSKPARAISEFDAPAAHRVAWATWIARGGPGSGT